MNTIECRAFEQWLDDGMPASGFDAALTHTRSCAECAAALAAAREIESLLAQDFARAPSVFTERVMARVELASAARAAQPSWASSSTFPWWVRAAAEPAVALALALAGLLMWRGDAVFLVASLWVRGVDAIAGWARGLASDWFPAGALVDPALAATLSRADVQLGLALGAITLLTLAALPLREWCESAFGRRRRRGV